MKKMIIVFCLFLFLFVFSYSQTGVDSSCRQNIENIFKVRDLKLKYEAIQSLYEVLDVEDSVIKNNYTGLHIAKRNWNQYFEAIKGFPLYSEEQEDSISSGVHGEIVPVKWLSDEEVNSYFKQINYCTPAEARKEYEDFVRNIKLEKEKCLKCIEAEHDKDDESEYAKESFSYSFYDSMSPFAPITITKLDFLKVFKEFVINSHREILPDDVHVIFFLKCNCKIL